MSRQAPQLGRDDWLARALEVLQDEGIRGVRVERLARDLGVTKGSFYWHFEDRDELYDNMLDYWTRVWTESVIEEVDELDLEPRAALLRLVREVTRRHMGRYDLAVRAWAAFDERAADAVARVDERRYRFVRSLFRALGFRGRQLEARARLYLYYQTVELSIRLGETLEDRLRLIPHRLDVLTKP